MRAVAVRRLHRRQHAHRQRQPAAQEPGRHRRARRLPGHASGAGLPRLMSACAAMGAYLRRPCRDSLAAVGVRRAVLPGRGRHAGGARRGHGTPPCWRAVRSWPCAARSCSAIGYARQAPASIRELAGLSARRPRPAPTSPRRSWRSPASSRAGWPGEALERAGPCRGRRRWPVHRRQAEAYRDYVELWIHEIKTPIAAANLMAADLHGPVATKLKARAGPHRVARWSRRSTTRAPRRSRSDYAIRETAARRRRARRPVKKNARYLIESGAIRVEVERGGRR